MKIQKAVFIFLLLQLSFLSFSANNYVMEEDKSISLIPINGEDVLSPHSIISVPIEAYYSYFLSSIVVTLADNIEKVDIEIFNSTTGEFQIFSTNEKKSFIPLAEKEGSYIISFTLINKKHCIGYIGYLIL